MTERAEADRNEADLSEIPEDKKWLYQVEGLVVSDGIKTAGGINLYLNSILLFYETIEKNADTIRNAYELDDINLYTIKVHALKTSARIVGANSLSKLAEELEAAGKHEDREFIKENTKRLLDDFLAFREKLSLLQTEDKSDLDEMSEEEYLDAISALKELVLVMDYDGVEMVIEGIRKYSLSDEREDLISRFEEAMKEIDWDQMEEILFAQ